ncbi:type III-A CRISPR-associated RAMP protein Csm5 [Calditerrivibrio nitroreducens]|uniref:CRISPR system Cms protein Csm5 n=1 Tax=Calditerrivibrio nitroreducens (strain DSM 19672 / NBRC 101217 / Yu37-1) TaxID=768670 RepID=E4TFE4_CALNY|nr:type III-A CRISPR-associated RAMP protein Csm5 [Calditerrivibrio nitroreducens]ADR19517.1 CRISPR-associated RAMP protein, Csm5 family [Calditerrivibrio nitroreducens DSM 19672]
MRVGHQLYYKVKYVPISPVHVGTGEEIDPLDYTIKNKVLYKINFVKFVENLSEHDKNQLLMHSKLPSVNSLMKVRTFINTIFDPSTMKDAIIESYPVDESIQARFSSRLSKFANEDPKNRQINELSIMEVYRNGLLPLIPGSSIKGAIRTAFLNHLLKDKDDRAREDILKNNFHGNKDPFDSLKVSDTYREKSDITVGFFINLPANLFAVDKIKGGLSVMAEVILPGKVYQGDIRFIADGRLFVKNENRYFSILRNMISNIESLFRICNEHYFPIFEKEYNMIKKENSENNFIKRVDYEKNNYLEQIRNNKVGLIRVGRHSGFEAVSIKGSKVKIKTKNGYDMRDASTTSWYCSFSDSGEPKNTNNVLPCGWMILKKDE